MFAIMKRAPSRASRSLATACSKSCPTASVSCARRDLLPGQHGRHHISPSQIRRFNLHTGDSIEGEVRTPKDGERYFALVKVDKVNGVAPEAIKHRIMFENLTPLHPNRTMRLERDIKSEENLTGRILDVFAPSAWASAA